MMLYLLLFIPAFSPDCFADYQTCHGPCWSDYRACTSPCEAAYQSCDSPCWKAYDGCNLREEWTEMRICMGGPAPSMMWCKIEAPSLWGVIASVLTLDCTAEMPAWCTFRDKDADGDVDLFDVAQWQAGLWQGTPTNRNLRDD